MVVEKNAELAALRQRMKTVPRITLLKWPRAVHTGASLGLRELDESRAIELRTLLPNIEGDSWQVARDLLEWASTCWQHDGMHEAEDADAVELLQRAEKGERFRCVEFGTLLADSLTAVGIPTRRVGLRQNNHAEPRIGKGHAVVEAWIDSLGKWILLDPQNASWWQRGDEQLSAAELMRMYAAGFNRPEFVNYDGTEEGCEYWWSCFATATIGGNFVTFEEVADVTFQQLGWLGFTNVFTNGECDAIYPSLHGASVSLTRDGNAKMVSAHPAATAVRIGDDMFSKDEVVFSLHCAPGVHTHSVELITQRGEYPLGVIQWEVCALEEPVIEDV